MAVPKFQDFLYPFLNQFRDKEVRSKSEIRNALIEHFQLTQEDIVQRTRSGGAIQLQDRIGWCRQWLRRAGFIEILQDGNYRITQVGKDYLLSHSDLRGKDLKKYPEFMKFAHPNHSNNGDEVTQEKKEDLANEELTPTEQLEKAYSSIESDLIEELLKRIMEQSPAFFERLVVDLLVKMGYGGSEGIAKVTQLSNDEGIDGTIYEDKLGLNKIHIQAKRWSNQVGRPVIQQFAGALVGKNATKGVFITTSDFSNEARQYVNNQSIVLINGRELAKYMIEYNVGVSIQKEYIIKKIDSDYFEE